MIYLIPLEQAELLRDVPEGFWAEAWENDNPDYDAGSWATPEALEGLEAIGVEPTILTEAEGLPVFHGLGSYIATSGYEDALSALCLASTYGPHIRGVSYVGYNCEAQIGGELVWSESRFFYYTRKQGRDFLWRVIVDSDDAAWCTGLWRHDENFMAWLEGLGLEVADDG